MNLFVTGASGFLGAYTIVQWLCQQPNGKVACLVRALTHATAQDKLMRVLGPGCKAFVSAFLEAREHGSVPRNYVDAPNSPRF